MFVVFLLVFQMIVAGYILAVHRFMTEEQRRLTPGNTPVRKRGNTQTQVGLSIPIQMV